MSLAQDSIVWLAVAGFAIMGIGALVWPERVTAQFDIPQLTPSGRNEVRAVYGGFGLAVAAVLLLALHRQGLREGVCLTVSAALAGMAGGRIVSAVRDRHLGRFPVIYLGIELVFAAALFVVA